MTQPCSQVTVKGEPCKNAALPGIDRCSTHLRPRGNRSLLTPEVSERLVSLVRAGNYEHVAARAAGIAPRTLKDWLTRGRQAHDDADPYRDLLQRVERARAEGEAVQVARIAQAAQEDWHAAAWFLERAHPERWARVAPRAAPELIPAQPAPPPGPFAEVDELARKRSQRPGV